MNNNKNIFKRNVSSFTKKNILVDAGLNLLNKNNFGNNSNQNFRSPNNQKKNGKKMEVNIILFLIIIILEKKVVFQD